MAFNTHPDQACRIWTCGTRETKIWQVDEEDLDLAGAPALHGEDGVVQTCLCVTFDGATMPPLCEGLFYLPGSDCIPLYIVRYQCLQARLDGHYCAVHAVADTQRRVCATYLVAFALLCFAP